MLKIYGVPISVHTRKVLVTAIEKKIPYENEPVVPFNPPTGWADLSPTGKIPVMADGDIVLRDSSVICTYLERTQPSVPLYPTDTLDHVRALWFEEYADGTLFPEVVHGLFFQKIIRPNILKQTTDAAVIEGILGEALPKAFGYLERSLGGDYLVGGRFGIADIATASNLINFNYLGYQVDAGRYPKLATYFERQLQRPSIQTALVAERKVATAMGLDQTFLGALAAA